MRPPFIWTAAVALGFGVAGLVWANLNTTSTPQKVVHIDLPIPPLAVLEHASSPAVAVSPDGAHVAYVSGDDASGQLYVHHIGSPERKAVADARYARAPFFSPDGQWLGFFSGGELRKIPVRGGDAATLCSNCADVHGASWGSKHILLARAGGLSRISSDGGTQEIIARPAVLWPESIPDRDVVVYTQGGWVWAHSMHSGERRRLVESGGNARYALGHIIYPSGGLLLAAPFDVNTLQLSGPSVPIVPGVMMGFPDEPAIAHFAISRTGTLAYLPGPVLSSPGRSLHWVDRHAREQELKVESRFYARPRISPDGTKVAVGYVENGNSEIGVYDLVRRTFSQLTVNAAIDDHPLWTPDGRRIIFRSTRNGGKNLFVRNADGTGQDQPLTVNPRLDADPFALTPDGKFLAYTQPNQRHGYDVHLLSMDVGYRSTPLIEEPGSHGTPTISPDGRWIAYRSVESGKQYQIVVRPFPNVADGRWQITADGAGPPLWSPNGREIFFTNAIGTLMSMSVEAKPFRYRTPQSVFTGSFTFGGDSRDFDVMPDGQRFLMIKDVEPPLDASVRDKLVIVSWDGSRPPS